MSKVAIHLGVHNHPITDGKCWELIEESRRLNAEEVDRTLDVNIPFLLSEETRRRPIHDVG
jgi:hypothetical protein